MKNIENSCFEGERALFRAEDLALNGCTFDNGESPLKHSRNIDAYKTQFRWKYPLWYSRDISVRNSTFYEMARAGIWYTDNVSLRDTLYIAPKGFRRCNGISLENVKFMNAEETLWACDNVELKNIEAKGDYFAMNSSNITVDGLALDGNYSFDGAKNVRVSNSRLLSKDAFWNAENIVCENCFISGEYLGWNSKDLTFINCTIESLQGLCFIDGLVMRGCRLNDTTLAFEYSTVDAEIIGSIDSVKNPSGGIIRADSIGELIMENDMVDTSKTQIILGNS